MLTTIVQRLRSRYASPRLRVITNDPEGIVALDLQLEPVVVGDRSLWQVTHALGIPAGNAAALRLDDLLPQRVPTDYQALLAEINPEAAAARQLWLQTLDESDAVFLMGGGYFTDAFARHATQLLTTVAEGVRRGLPTFIVGCGFEPISEPRFQQIARDVLPHVRIIACREATTSPSVLTSLNVAPEQFVITGDDAVELAYNVRPATLGDRIGISLRDHSYNPVDDEQYRILRQVLETFANEKRAALQPVPISNYLPNDMEAIQQILPENVRTSDNGSPLNTPERLIGEIAHCRIMIAGSYHAAVFALSMGVPAICLARSSHYQYKMSGLLSMFGINPGERLITFDNIHFAERLREMLQQVWAGAEAERPLLQAAAREQVKNGLAAYAAIFEEIDAALLCRDKGQNAPTVAGASEESRAMIEVLRGLARQITQLRSDRDYLQYHADERLKIIETYLSGAAQANRTPTET